MRQTSVYLGTQVCQFLAGSADFRNPVLILDFLRQDVLKTSPRVLSSVASSVNNVPREPTYEPVYDDPPWPDSA
jgi:hypothetical protein